MNDLIYNALFYIQNRDKASFFIIHHNLRKHIYELSSTTKSQMCGYRESVNSMHIYIKFNTSTHYIMERR